MLTAGEPGTKGRCRAGVSLLVGPRTLGPQAAAPLALLGREPPQLRRGPVRRDRARLLIGHLAGAHAGARHGPCSSHSKRANAVPAAFAPWNRGAHARSGCGL